ncbi:uncharacterized protein [Phyllobates terribilis]|uniref:uncharacterized protein n=1 Tax=Phyllobates terribilis TaxID=111132 RepID=UPI003CCACB54
MDAFEIGVEEVLWQNSSKARNHSCGFFSRKFSPAKQNYSIGDRELLAIKLGLEKGNIILNELNSGARTGVSRVYPWQKRKTLLPPPRAHSKIWVESLHHIQDGGLRPCLDFREINKITVRNPYPLPLIPDLFNQLLGAKWFSKIDLKGAYNLLRMKEGDEWKTAFNTPVGHFENLVMPFGLTNAPAFFQNLINDILRPLIGKNVVVYLDDILIYSPDLESHWRSVREVLQLLMDNSLFAKLEKCEFAMDPVKVQAVQEWPRPIGLKSIQRFLGFANYYRKFIKNFSSIVKPLTDLTRKGADAVQWSSEAIEAFVYLKERFTSAPILMQPDVTRPFLVEVDASSVGVGAVLSQDNGDGLHPCAFFSKKFSETELNYDIGNRELLAIKLAFEHWRHFLEGAEFPVQVLTDHKNLIYLDAAKRLNARQARWALFFSRFNFSVTYIPGTKNVKADALSRSFSPIDGGLRPCLDFREINKITVRNPYPLPLIPDLFNQLLGAKWFSKIDLKGAYNLLRMKEGDEWKTAFNTPVGHFENLVMPFGLTNAPAFFQNLINDILRPLIGKNVVVYLDNILIYSPDLESHWRSVREVLQLLMDNSLFAKLEKCEFAVQRISFLGYIISSKGFEMDPVKVQAVQEWPRPIGLKSIQRFLGFANYYRKFIKNFSSIVKPLTDLTRKGADATCFPFLGYIVSKTGLKMDPEKVSADLKWPHPEGLKVIQQFLGLANYYRQFIPHFSSWTPPISALTCKGTNPKVWTPEAEDAFVSQKQAFSSAPALHRPNNNKQFFLESDSSYSGAGSVLTQKSSSGRIVTLGFFSKIFSAPKCNYSIGDRELLAIKLALEEWRYLHE